MNKRFFEEALKETQESHSKEMALMTEKHGAESKSMRDSHSADLDRLREEMAQLKRDLEVCFTFRYSRADLDRMNGLRKLPLKLWVMRGLV